AQRGADLVLVARREDRLQALAEELAAAGRQVHVLARDIAVPAAGPALAAAVGELVGDRLVDTVVNNAGFGLYGPLLGQDPGRLEQMLSLNVTALTSITRTFLEPMVAAGRGTLVNVASTGGFQPAPGLAAYVASKAYVLHLTEALWHETRHSGVRVTALCPGPTETAFFDAAGSEHGPLGGNVTTPEQVVGALLRTLDGRTVPPYLVPDLPNRVQSVAARLLPRRLTLEVAARVMKQR
uniref:SDR family NAD(P)-dependent oxidoreductase n=1 Tax=Desertihabitans aurantiacus TaxID=2282477 RepID=UPI000DF72BFC